MCGVDSMAANDMKARLEWGRKEVDKSTPVQVKVKNLKAGIARLDGSIRRVQNESAQLVEKWIGQ